MPGLYGFDDNKLLKEAASEEDMRKVLERVNNTENTVSGIKDKTDKVIKYTNEENPTTQVHTSSIELFGNPWGFIDFRYNNSSEDYTSRIIEVQSGVLRSEELFYGGQITNLNNAPLGFSIAPGDAANNPYSFFVTVLTVGGTAGKKDKYCQQIIYPWGANDSKSFATRAMDNGQWTEWRYHYNTGELHKYATVPVKLEFQKGTWTLNTIGLDPTDRVPSGYRIGSIVPITYDSHIVDQIVNCKFFGSSQVIVHTYGGATVTTDYTLSITYVKT